MRGSVRDGRAGAMRGAASGAPRPGAGGGGAAQSWWLMAGSAPGPVRGEARPDGPRSELRGTGRGLSRWGSSSIERWDAGSGRAGRTLR